LDGEIDQFFEVALIIGVFDIVFEEEMDDDAGEKLCEGKGQIHLSDLALRHTTGEEV
jgi:hypothetical protein